MRNVVARAEGAEVRCVLQCLRLKLIFPLFAHSLCSREEWFYKRAYQIFAAVSVSEERYGSYSKVLLHNPPGGSRLNPKP